MNNLNETVNQALEESVKAFKIYKNVPGKDRAIFLRLIGEEIMNLGDELVQTCVKETNLPEERIVGERGRTVDQLNKFADLIDEGSWLEATIDTGNPHRQPAPKPDLRRILVPLGPVVVFGAGNFPLAFSVAGGDTASALAGGNTVIVKAHPAHPKTGELVAQAIRSAIFKSKLPEGIFGFIQDSGYESGQLLVKHKFTKAVAFTGSFTGGMALVEIASKREEPIPVFAEMGSTNPVIIFKEALKINFSAIAAKLVASVNLGAGQFCTNPGLIITTKTEGFDDFIRELSLQVNNASGAKMFSEGVMRNYIINSEKIFSHSEVNLIGKGKSGPVSDNVPPAIGLVSASDFINRPSLHEEVFGPFSLVVACDSDIQLLEVLETLKGQLTATIHALENELEKHKEMIDTLLDKCGRLLLNGVPTGVEVSSAMQHGGPFPASSDARFTSVGTSAIKRFVRPVCYQDFPQTFLPKELQDSNPLKIWRQINNQWTKEPV
jgi:NADP-dependent aldehyde dehydrogenase